MESDKMKSDNFKDAINGKSVVEEEGSIGVKARSALWYLTFFGFAINYIVRINASITIVDMIDVNYKRTSITNRTIVTTSECLVGNNFSRPDLSGESLNSTKNLKYVSLERKLLEFLKVEYDEDGFKWDEHQQSLVLSSFFWLHWATQLPGGILAAKYGTKFVFGFANFIGCVMCILMPITCYLDFRLMVGLRILQGFVVGFTIPAMHHLTGQWIPPNERSKFVSAYFGSSIGIAVAYPIFGFIIKASSWEWVFHACGIVGTIWYLLWLYYVYDSPEKHPRIHPKEKEYILATLGSSVIRSSKKRDVPWKAIFTSKAVWINCMSQWGGIWALFTLLTQSPTYFRFIHGWGIEMIGILSGLPHLLCVAFSILFSILGDYLMSSGKMSRNNVRRLATFFCMIVNGSSVLCLAYTDCNVTLAVLFMSLSLGLYGAVSTGPLSAIVDIAPNFSGITMGIVSSVALMSGFVSPIIVGYITFENQSIDAWSHIFELSAGMLIVCGSIYIWLSDTSIQPWNKTLEKSDSSKELVPLKASNVTESVMKNSDENEEN